MNRIHKVIIAGAAFGVGLAMSCGSHKQVVVKQHPTAVGWHIVTSQPDDAAQKLYLKRWDKIHEQELQDATHYQECGIRNSLNANEISQFAAEFERKSAN